MIIALSGFAGSGKDAAADILVRDHNFVKVAIADPLKRIAKEVYDFTDEQLWGPSEERNKPDERYPREHGPFSSSDRCLCCGEDVPEEYRSRTKIQCYLTPRYALQLLGTEWGRHCYPHTWMDYAVRVARRLMESREVSLREVNLREVNLREGPPHMYFPNLYDPRRGILEEWGLPKDASRKGVVISDVRFKNEMERIKSAGGILVRVKRKGYSKPMWDHPSEREQHGIPDERFDLLLNNDKDLGVLTERVGTMLRAAQRL